MDCTCPFCEDQGACDIGMPPIVANLLAVALYFVLPLDLWRWAIVAVVVFNLFYGAISGSGWAFRKKDQRQEH